MKYLITGESGQVGSAVKKRLEDPIGVSRNSGNFEIDISTKEIFDCIIEVSPDVIVHTAAFTRMDEAEKNPKSSQKVNVGGTQHIINAAERIDAHVIFISTDFVFDGKQGYYSEVDETNPGNIYASHKYEAEQRVKNSRIPTTIFRSALVFDGVRDNFFTWIKRHLKDFNSVGIVIDQICNPTYAGDLADIIVEAGENKITGTFHATGMSIVSRYEAAILFSREVHLDGSIQPVTRDQLSWNANRPPNTSLNISKLLNTFESTPQPLSQALKAAFE